MLDVVKTGNKKYFDKQELLSDIKKTLLKDHENIKNIIVLDFAMLLKKEDIQDEKIKLNQVVIPKPDWGSSFVVVKNSLKKEFEEKEKQIKLKETAQRMRDSRIPKNYINKTFHDVEQLETLDNCLQAIKKYLKNHKKMLNEGTGLLMFGGVGTGKTFLMSLLGKYLIKNGKRVLFYDTTDLFTTIKHSFSKENNLNEYDILRDVLICDVLIIDDLGAEKPTEWVLDKLFYIVNQRITNNKPILVTSNYTQEELLGRLGDKPRIISRLLAKSIIVQNKAQDYRLNEHKEVMNRFKELSDED